MKTITMKLVRVLIVLGVIAALGFGGYQLIQIKKGKLAKAPKYGLAATPVHVVKAVIGSLSEKRTYLAICEPVRQASVAAKITELIDEIGCDEGDRVKAGEVLIELDDREVKESIAAMESDIERAGADLAGNDAIVKSLKESVAYWDREAKRDETLAAKGDIPGSQAEATVEKANEFRGNLLSAEERSRALKNQADSLARKKKQLEVQLSYTKIRSPYDGIVTRRLVDPGDLASPGKTLLIVEDRSQLKLSFDVPQEDLAEIHEGLTLQFTVDGKKRESVLTHLYPSLNHERMIRAESLVEDREAGGLVCGSFIPASVVVRSIKDAVLVPASSIVESPDGTLHVFVVRGDVLAHPAVEELGRNGEQVAVTGISGGEMVVTSTFLGWANLASDMKVEPIQ